MQRSTVLAALALLTLTLTPSRAAAEWRAVQTSNFRVLGDVSAVFRWLDRAVVAKSPNLATLKTHPDFAVVHDDPRWATLTASLP